MGMMKVYETPDNFQRSGPQVYRKGVAESKRRNESVAELNNEWRSQMTASGAWRIINFGERVLLVLTEER